VHPRGGGGAEGQNPQLVAGAVARGLQHAYLRAVRHAPGARARAGAGGACVVSLQRNNTQEQDATAEPAPADGGTKGREGAAGRGHARDVGARLQHLRGAERDFEWLHWDLLDRGAVPAFDLISFDFVEFDFV